MPDIKLGNNETLGDVSIEMLREVIDEIREHLHQRKLECDYAFEKASVALLAEMKRRATLGVAESSLDGLLGRLLAAGLYFTASRSVSAEAPIVAIRGLAGQLLTAATYAGILPRGSRDEALDDDEQDTSVGGTLINGLAVRGEVLAIFHEHPLWVAYQDAWEATRKTANAMTLAEESIKIVEDELAAPPPTGRPVILGDPPKRANKEA